MLMMVGMMRGGAALGSVMMMVMCHNFDFLVSGHKVMAKNVQPGCKVCHSRSDTAISSIKSQPPLLSR